MARTSRGIQENNPTIGTGQRHSAGRHGLPTDIKTQVSIEARLKPTDEVILRSLDDATHYLKRELIRRCASIEERRRLVGRFESTYYSNVRLYSGPKALLELVQGTLKEYKIR